MKDVFEGLTWRKKGSTDVREMAKGMETKPEKIGQWSWGRGGALPGVARACVPPTPSACLLALPPLGTRFPLCYDCRHALSVNLIAVRRFCARARVPRDKHMAAERDAMNRPHVLDGCFRGTPRQKALEMDL